MAQASIYRDGTYWDINHTFHEEDAEFKVRNAIGVLGDLRPDSILDMGCGGGRNLRLLCDHYQCRGLGVDISPDAIAHAQQWKTDTVTYRIADIDAIDGHYRLATLFDVFEHVDDYIGFLRKVRGRAEYYLFNIPLDMGVLELLTDQYMINREKVGHLHYFSMDSALATLEYAGYTVLRSQYVNTRWHQIKHNPQLAGWKKLIYRALFAPLSIASETFRSKLLGGSVVVLAR